MAPRKVRRSGTARVVHTLELDTPVGRLLAGATPTAVCLLEFLRAGRAGSVRRRLREELGWELVPGETPLLRALQAQLGEYFAGARRAFDLPLEAPGSAFRRRVWDGLLRIPYGQTRSYGELARAIGRPGASRAVGQANGDNRIAILIPCHRVIAADGGPGGYGGGLWRKARLLEIEGVRLTPRSAA